MSKKKQEKVTPRLSEAQLYRPQAEMADAPTPKPKKSAFAPQATRIPTDAELAEEYRYVVNDLKRIGLLALVMLAVLVGLAFVLI